MLRKVTSLFCDLYYRAIRFFLAQQRTHELDSLSSVERHDPEAIRRIDEGRQSSEKLLLQRLLRRVPYWSAGHASLAELSLRDKDTALAYSSANAVLALEGRESAHGNLLLARSLLASGDGARALSILEPLSVRSSDSLRPKILEELAAALILAGEYKRASEALKKVPERLLSPEAKAAEIFLRTKV